MQERTRFGLVERCGILDGCQRVAGGVEGFLLLRQIADLHATTEAHLSGKRWKLARDGLQQR